MAARRPLLREQLEEARMTHRQTVEVALGDLHATDEALTQVLERDLEITELLDLLAADLQTRSPQEVRRIMLSLDARMPNHRPQMTALADAAAKNSGNFRWGSIMFMALQGALVTAWAWRAHMHTWFKGGDSDENTYIVNTPNEIGSTVAAIVGAALAGGLEVGTQHLLGDTLFNKIVDAVQKFRQKGDYDKTLLVNGLETFVPATADEEEAATSTASAADSTADVADVAAPSRFKRMTSCLPGRSSSTVAVPSEDPYATASVNDAVATAPKAESGKTPSVLDEYSDDRSSISEEADLVTAASSSAAAGASTSTAAAAETSFDESLFV